MMNQYTQRTKAVLNRGLVVAEQLNHDIIGTEHILAGLVLSQDCVAAQILAAMNFDTKSFLQALEETAESSPSGFGHRKEYSPRVKNVLNQAREIAVSTGVNYIATEHILLAILREGEGSAAQYLGDCDITYDKVIDFLTSGNQEECSGCSGSSNPWQTGKQGKGGKTGELDKVSRDLTQMAASGELDPVIGRDKEIERVVQILSRRTKNNPVLIGEAGVGKTAIAEGLAQRIVSGNVPGTISGKRVFSLDLSGLVAGTKYRGEFEERLQKILGEIKKAKDVIVFIDEIHTLVGAGATEGSMDAANILKPALSRGELQCIGATTLDEYRKYIEKDAALERRFQPVQVDEPSEEDSIEILKGLKDSYEAHHKVSITDEAIENAVKLSVRYISDRFLPDKAIDLMDEASSKVRMNSLISPKDIKALEDELALAEQEKQEAVQLQEYEKAVELRDRCKSLKDELKAKRDNWQKEQQDKILTVGADDIADVVSLWTKIPVSRLKMEEKEKLLRLEETLHQRLIGQEEAVKAVSAAIRRSGAGLKNVKRPVGSFIFLGPTGVGKTELAKALAEAVFGNEEAMTRIDMSEYMERHTVSRLVGAPPGYVGYEEGGQLTEAVRRNPYCVILLDEIEKAHPEVFNILLQVLDDGRLTDSTGRTVDFRNAIIIMTSNVGAENAFDGNKSVGFLTSDASSDENAVKERYMADLKKTFRPEFINRIDEIIVFHSLKKEEICSIARLMFHELKESLKERNIDIDVTDAALDYLAEIGYDKAFGARPLRRMIQTKVENPLADKLLAGDFVEGDTILVDQADGEIKFTKEE